MSHYHDQHSAEQPLMTVLGDEKDAFIMSSDAEAQNYHAPGTASSSLAGRSRMQMLCTSSWYIVVSTGAIFGLALVLAGATLLLGVHFGICHLRSGFSTGSGSVTAAAERWA